MNTTLCAHQVPESRSHRVSDAQGSFQRESYSGLWYGVGEPVDFSVRYHMMGIQSHQQWDKMYTTHFQRDIILTFSP